MNVYVRIRFEKSSEAFLDALAELIQAVDGADAVLVTDRIVEANEKVKANLQGMDFTSA